MNNEPYRIESFVNDNFGKLRIVDVGGQIWFVGRDVAAALGYSNPSKAIIMHVDTEDKISQMVAHSQNGNTGMSKTSFINESGVYSLVLSSKLPSAKLFKRWVTSEVLPAVRNSGSYKLPDFTNPALAARAWADEFENRKKAEQKVQLLSLENEEKTKVIEEQAPKADYYDVIAKGVRDNIISIREACKQIGTPERKTISMLVQRGYLYRGKNNMLLPTARHSDVGDGMFTVQEICRGVYNDKDGVSRKLMSSQTKVTVEGKSRLLSLCKRWGFVA